MRKKILMWMLVTSMVVGLLPPNTMTVAADTNTNLDSEMDSTDDSSVETEDVSATSPASTSGIGTVDASESVAINETTFPDDIFRDYVSRNFDKDADGVLSPSERASAIVVSISSLNIKDFTGIGYFTKISSLSIEDTLVQSLDLSDDTPLESLELNRNTKLTSLNLSGCNHLDKLSVTICSKLNQLDVSGCIALKDLSVTNCQLGTLDVSDCERLERLSVGSNSLKELSLENNSAVNYLAVGSNDLKSLDVSPCTNLTQLDLSDNYDLTELTLGDINELQSLNCYHTSLTSLDVTNQHELTYLSCSQNQLEKLDLSQNTNLQNLYCSNNALSELSLSTNQNLQYVECSNNKLSELDLSANTELTSLYVCNNRLHQLDLSNNIKLKTLDISGNKILTIDTSKLENLTVSTDDTIWCQKDISVAVQEQDDGTWLADLSDITGYAEGFQEGKFSVSGDDDNPASITKKGISWKNNPISTIWEKTTFTFQSDISNEYRLPGAEYKMDIQLTLWNSDMDMDYVDINKKNFPDDNFRQYLTEQYGTEFQPGTIKYLGIGNMGIADLTGIEFFTALKTLYCWDNELTSLNLSKNTKLETVDCSGNRLVSLDISNNPNLEYLSAVQEEYCLKVVQTENGYQASGDIVSSLDISQLSYDGLYDNGIVHEWKESGAATNLLSTAVKQGDTLTWLSKPLVDIYQLKERYSFTLDNGIRQFTMSIPITFQNGYDTDFDMTEIPVDKAHFPDEGFREYLKTYYGDRIQPGIISSLSISGSVTIDDLQGIEYFKTLKVLYLYHTGLKSLDLSQNTALCSLDLGNANLYSLDLRKNTLLSYVDIWECPLTALYLPEKFSGTKVLTNKTFVGTVEDKDGEYVLDMTSYGGLDANRIVDLSDGEVEGDMIVWKNQEDIPLELSYQFSLYQDVDDETKLQDGDCLTVDIVLTNITEDAPVLPQGTMVALTEDNFPTAGFRQFLADCYDADGDNQINTAAVKSLYLSNQQNYNFLPENGESPLKGIELLECLQTLTATSLSLSGTLDLSQNTMLTSVSLDGNSLTGVDVSGCKYLKKLDLSYNSLRELDVTENSMLQTLDLSNNALVNLDITANKKLTVLDVDSNQLVGLDVSNNDKLQSLSLYNAHKVTELDVSAMKNLVDLNVAETGITKLDVSSCRKLEDLSAGKSSEEALPLDLRKNTSLKYLVLQDCSIEADWEKLTSLEYIYVTGGSITQSKLDFSGFAVLDYVTLSGIENLTELDASNCASLGRLNVNGEKLDSLNVTGDTALNVLQCMGDQLQELDVSTNPALQTLYCENNQLSNLDITHNLALKYFECYNNPIESLDLSQNKSMLTDLNCEHMSLSSLDLGNNEELVNVEVSNQVFVYPIEEESSEDITETNPSTGTSIGENTEGTFATTGSSVLQESAEETEVLPVVQSLKSLINCFKKAEKTESYTLNLSKYGDFDSNRVSSLSSGTVVDNGIQWDSVEDVPDRITYTYDVSNEYKVKNKIMQVTIVTNANSLKKGEYPGTGEYQNDSTSDSNSSDNKSTDENGDNLSDGNNGTEGNENDFSDGNNTSEGNGEVISDGNNVTEESKDVTSGDNNISGGNSDAVSGDNSVKDDIGTTLQPVETENPELQNPQTSLPFGEGTLLPTETPMESVAPTFVPVASVVPTSEPNENPVAPSVVPTADSSQVQQTTEPSPVQLPQNTVVPQSEEGMEKISLNASVITLYTAGEKQFQLKVTGNATSVRWESSNEKVVTVTQDGLITAKKKGIATITVTCNENGQTLTCKVTVKRPKVTIKKSLLIIKKGKKAKINYALNPKGDKPVFISKNKKVAKVTAVGVVKGIRKGNTKIIVKYGGVSKVVKIHVK